MLIGLLAVGGLSLLLVDRFAHELAHYRQQRQVAAKVAATCNLSALVHELQTERGLTAGFLADPDPAQRAALLAQHPRTDRELTAIVEPDPLPARRPETLSAAGLAVWRQEVLRGETSFLAAHRTYSAWNQELLDQVGQLARLSENALFKDDLIAHAHLLFLKEYLGRIRAKINYALRVEGDGGRAMTAEISRLQALFAEYQRQFRRDAAPAPLADFRQGFSGPEVELVLRIIELAARDELAAGEIAADRWFTLASAAINRLREVEERSLARLLAAGDQAMAAIRQRLLFFLAGALLLGGGIVVLVLATTRKILTDLGRLLAEISRIRKKQDFSRRITAAAPDELGAIARAFNELLAIVERLLREQTELAGTDQLTGLANRRRFNEFFERELNRRQRQATPLSLLLFDLDHFKRINDQYGHEVGDLVLGEVARLTGGAIRRTDLAARWGGEEFVVLLPDTDQEAARQLAEKLRATIAAHDFPRVGKLTVSFGVTSLLAEESGDKGLFKRADQALYQAKAGGRNRVEVA